MPASPAELVARVASPKERFVLVTAMAEEVYNGWLPPEFVEQRLADLQELIQPTKPEDAPLTQSEIAREANLTRQCVNALVRRLRLGESQA
jgi:hypothetical protein